MQTQQVGTDIAADVSWTEVGDVPIFLPTYQFKGTLTHPGQGLFVVTINRGEGIDLAHAEVVVHYNFLTELNWKVEELAPLPTGERVYRVSFALITGVGGPPLTSITFVPTDPSGGSITIRRKVPSVN